jgi:uncharacterized protein (DUF2336 family)
MSKIASTPSDPAQAVNVSIIDELIGAVDSGSAKQRQKILQRITDLFVAGSRNYSREQVALFDDVLQQISNDIEVRARARMAQRLAGIENAPPALIRNLAFDDEVAVAAPVLANSMLLTDADLVENARTKSQKHLLAIAQRLKLSEAVTDVLVERGDREVVRKVARNRGARFSLAGYDKLTAHARYDRRLTLALGERTDIPRQHFLKLLECASATVRAKLEAANPDMAEAVRKSVDDVATAMQHGARAASELHSAAERKARRFKAHPVTEGNVHAPARAQEFEKVVIALARLGRFPVDLVERALVDEGTDMVLILARAAGCSWATAKELLQMQAAGRRMTESDWAQAQKRYTGFSADVARSILDFYRQRMKEDAEAQKAREKQAEKGDGAKAPTLRLVAGQYADSAA